MATKKKIPIWDTRMLTLMDHCISNKIKCTNQKEWCKVIGFRANTIKQVREGISSFRHTHLFNAAKQFGVSVDYLYGLSENMIRNSASLSVSQLLQQALLQLNKNK